MSEKDSIERELRNLLSVNPTPGFEDRVRAHVDRKPKAFSWNLRWAFAAAAVAAAIIAAVLVFQPQRESKTEVAVTASRSVALSPVVEPERPPKLPAAHRRVTKAVKAAKAEPQLIIAANEASAMRRLLSGGITELLPAFEPKVREFLTPETVVEPLPPPAAVTIDPIEPSAPAVE